MPYPGLASSTPAPRPVAAGSARRALGATATVVLLGVLGACGSDDPSETSGTSDPTPSVSASNAPGTEVGDPTPSADPTDADDSDEGDEGTGGDGTGEPAGTLSDALLAADRLPGLNEDAAWTEGVTGPVGSEAFGWCAEVDLLSIGASEGVQRTFTAGEGDQAGQQVLDLVDETNGRRVEQTLRGWHDDCQARTGAQVGDIQSVPVSAGEAWWYLSSRPSAEGEWESYGVVRQGSRLTVLRMQHVGQDHSYEAGEDPLEIALQRAADQLG